MSLDDVTDRLHRITRALEEKSVPYAVVGGQAVALWVATREPAAVRTTKDVDLLIRRDDLPRARAAALSAGMDYFEVLGVGMFLDRNDPNPRHAVHLVWAGEKVRPEYELPSPAIDQRQAIAGIQAVSLPGLVLMKLLANRDQDRVHLRDMIDVGLVGREMLDAAAARSGRALGGPAGGVGPIGGATCQRRTSADPALHRRDSLQPCRRQPAHPFGHRNLRLVAEILAGPGDVEVVRGGQLRRQEPRHRRLAAQPKQPVDRLVGRRPSATPPAARSTCGPAAVRPGPESRRSTPSS